MAMRKNVNFFNMSNVTLHNDGNTFLIVSCHPLKKSGCNELWFFNATVLMHIHIWCKASVYISFQFQFLNATRLLEDPGYRKET